MKRQRSLGAALAVAMLLGGSGAARATDGIGALFQQIFGGGGPRESSQPLPQPEGAMPSSPPLTVRMHKHRRPTGAALASGHRYSPADLKGITIYTDRTLVPGDAVMTAKGVRIFNGNPSLPHTADDFVALSSTARIPKTVRKELSAIDSAARSDFRSE